MVVARGIYIIIFPQLVTCAAFVLAVITFLCGHHNVQGLKNVHFMTLDLENLNIGGQSINALANAVNIKDVYTVGMNGICFGDSPSTLNNCSTPVEPFYFNFDEILTVAGYDDLITDLPSQISDYNKISKDVSLGAWGCFLASIILIFLQFLFGFASIVSGIGMCITTICCTLATTAAGLGAALVTGLYYVYRDKINDIGSTFGVNATLDPSGFGVAWGTVAALIVADFLYMLGACFSRRKSTRYVTLPEKEFGY